MPSDKRRQAPQRRQTADTQKPAAAPKSLSSNPSTSTTRSTFLDTDVVIIAGCLDVAAQEEARCDIIAQCHAHSYSPLTKFINALLEGLSSQIMRVGSSDSLQPCTKEVVYDILEGKTIGKNYRLVVVDTPGFDSTYGSDSGVLRQLVRWCQTWLPQGGCRGGVIVLHDMNANPGEIPSDEDIATVSNSFKMAIATTKWTRYQPPENGPSHHDLLCEQWKVPFAYKFDSGSNEAWAVVRGLLAQIENGPNVDFTGKFNVMMGNRVVAEKVHEGIREEARKSLRKRIGDAFKRLFGLKK